MSCNLQINFLFRVSCLANLFGDAVATSIIETLGKNTTLTRLSLASPRIDLNLR